MNQTMGFSIQGHFFRKSKKILVLSDILSSTSMSVTSCHHLMCSWGMIRGQKSTVFLSQWNSLETFWAVTFLSIFSSLLDTTLWTKIIKLHPHRIRARAIISKISKFEQKIKKKENFGGFWSLPLLSFLISALFRACLNLNQP